MTRYIGGKNQKNQTIPIVDPNHNFENKRVNLVMFLDGLKNEKVYIDTHINRIMICTHSYYIFNAHFGKI